MSTERAITLLHLSDLQFGPYHRFESQGELGSLLERLRQDLDWLGQEQGLKPDLILLTGDLSELGKKSEFDQVHQFAQRLAQLVELPTRNVVLVPGNHDINRKASEAYFNECEANEEQPKPPYWPKLRHYSEFFARFYEGETAIRFTEGEPWSFFEYPELKVVVAGLNSTMADSHRKEDHYGFLGEHQLRAFAEKLRPYKEQGFLRIGAVHHDVLHPQNDSARQDIKDLKRILGPYLNVVLHGHIHEEQVDWLDSTVPVLCIGSAGLKLEKRAPEVPNQYQIVQVTRNGLRFGSRAYVPDQKRWVGDVRADPQGQTWLIEKNVAFERVEEVFSGGPVEAAPARDLARVVESYRRHVVLDRQRTLFDLIGFGEDRDIPGGLDLLRIFVPQSVALRLKDFTPATGAPEGVAGPAEKPASARESSTVAESPDVDVELAIVRPIDQTLINSTRPWLFMLGAPGAGKTVITRWLMLALCAPGERPEGFPDDLVPVRIEMRRFDEAYRRANQRPYDFFAHLDEVHGEMSLALRGELLRELANSGRLLWLFDGMDEVPVAHDRRRYAEMIAGLKAEYVRCRGLITSRIEGAEQVRKVLDSARVHIGTLLDFDEGQTDLFLNRWHEVAFPGGPETGKRRRERLARALAASPALRDLSRNPLLLTMIAYLNRDEELPHRRHRLYQRTIERMADQWDANKLLSAGSATARFSLDHKTRFLRRLAWQMMNDAAHGQGNAIHERALHKFAADFCEQTYGEAPDAARRTADELLQHLRERNYVLTLLGGRLFGFVHKTFLEYLAATEIHARFRSQEWALDELGRVFQDHWHDDAWTETLTLVCGIIEEDRPEQVVEVLQRVATEGAKWTNVERVAYVAFAIRCLAEVDRIEQEPVRSFAVRLTDLLKHELTASDTPGWGSTAAPVLPALRLHTGQWPGFELLRRWAKDDAIASGPMLYTSAYQCAIAAGGTERRSALLRDALSTDRLFIPRLMQEAGALGPWTREEIDDLVEVSASKSDLDKRTILSSIPLHSSGSVELSPNAAQGAVPWHEQARLNALYVLFVRSREHELSARARAVASESIHRGAAHANRDPSVLAELAASARDEHVRREANFSLTSLKLLKALVQVGKPRQGRVRLSGKPVGILEETRTGGSRFLYDRAYLDLPNAIPISPTIPLRKEPYESQGLHPFFKNLLPEGWLLDLTCRKLGLAHSDKFGLLLATGADCMGAVEVVPADDEAA